MTVQSPQVTSTPPVQPTTITVTETSSPSAALPPKTTTLSSVATSSFLNPCASITAKAVGGLKVSFRDRIKALQSDGSPSPSNTPPPTTSLKDPVAAAPPPSDKHDLREKLISPLLGSKMLANTKPPSAALSIKEKLRQFSHGHLHGQGMSTLKYSEDALKPWSKLKMATVVATGGSYSSLSSSQNEESPTEPKTSEPKNEDELILEPVPTDENQVPSGSDADTSRTPKLKTNKVRPFNLQHSEPKNYKSVDDLSPEYSGLPFVKKLKILNERQKLAALESVIQTRSISLDCADPETADADLSDSLIRSYSEASGMARTKKHSIVSANMVPIGDTGPLRKHHATHVLPNSPLLSPESNETMERRHLKSILKRLSDEKSQDSSVDVNGQLQLMQAQTIEGYVARHSKFAKSVTFNSTLSSPPHSARSDQLMTLSCVGDYAKPSQFPAFNAQPTPSSNVTRTTSQSPPTFLQPLTTSIDTDNVIQIIEPEAMADQTIHTEEHSHPATINEDQPVVAKKFIKGRSNSLKTVMSRT